MYVQEVGWGCGTYMPQDRDKWPVVLKMVMNPRVNVWTSGLTVSFSERAVFRGVSELAQNYKVDRRYCMQGEIIAYKDYGQSMRRENVLGRFYA